MYIKKFEATCFVEIVDMQPLVVVKQETAWVSVNIADSQQLLNVNRCSFTNCILHTQHFVVDSTRHVHGKIAGLRYRNPGRERMKNC